jgi:hypothetical protein
MKAGFFNLASEAGQSFMHHCSQFTCTDFGVKESEEGRCDVAGHLNLVFVYWQSHFSLDSFPLLLSP